MIDFDFVQLVINRLMFLAMIGFGFVATRRLVNRGR